MNKDDKKLFDYVDSGNISHSVEIKDEDFNLVQVDKSIHDTKFKSKPTTFFKDACKRFAKNKASVVGAVILGILLLGSIIVPLADTNIVEGDRSAERFLPSKLFPTGTGFWDGTTKLKGIVIDKNSIGKDPKNKETYNKQLPAKIVNEFGVTEYKEAYISNLTNYREGLTNSPTEFAEGGQLLLRSTKIRHNPVTPDEEYIEDSLVNYISPDYKFDKDKNYVFTVDYQEDFKDEVMGYSNGEYRLELRYGPYQQVVSFEDNKEDNKEEGKTEIKAAKDAKPEEKPTETSTIPLREHSIVLGDFSKEDLSISLDEAIKRSGLNPTDEDLKAANIVVALKPSFDEDQVLPLSLVKVEEDEKVVPTISVTNPALNLTYLSTDIPNYWRIHSLGNGSKGLANAKCLFADFTYDNYSDTYGYRIDTYSSTEIIGYIKKGLLPADLINYEDPKNPIFNTDYVGFNFYKTKCADGKVYNQSPVAIIHEYDIHQGGASDPKTYSFTTTSLNYRRLGYDEMPTFIFGTNQDGYDLFKIVFIGLRTSLLLGLFASSICFFFGLVYGAIEGYFGGTVDLAMQRFTDILSGVPWIVVMTLMIIKFGQSFWVFAAALCLTGWIGTAGLTRTQFYRFRGREYILASRTLGANDFRLIFRHILPNAMGTIITSSVLMIPSVIFQEATISYLGLGLKGMNSLGIILSDNQKYLQDYPNLLIVPAVVIALIMISFNLFGNGLRDAFNPSLKGSE